MIHQSHLNSAVSILQSYNGEQPFHLFLKTFFSLNKKYGSKDRKQVASLCYNFFRPGHAAKGLPVEERILLGTFLCETKPSPLLQFFKPEWNDAIGKPIKEKLAIGNKQLAIENIFPFQNELSEGIDAEKFNQSFLNQPKLFLRIRPGHEKTVLQKIESAGLQYELLSESCIALPNSTKIDSIIEIDKEAVIQDYNSQRIGEFLRLPAPGSRLQAASRLPADFPLRTPNSELRTHLWDCCTASGGKSIMAYDIIPNIELTVSDKRESILQNLHQRFKKAGIKNYHSFIADLAKEPVVQPGIERSSRLERPDRVQPGTSNFELVLADVPCTGSGTWSRSPEQLYFFKKEKINEYSSRQKKIIQNVIPSLKKNGHFLYITCSVFKKENEEVADFIKEKFHLKLIKMELLKGYEMQADTLFAALFKSVDL